MKEYAVSGTRPVTLYALLALLIVTLFISAGAALSEGSEADISDPEGVLAALASEMMGETAGSPSHEDAADHGESDFTPVSSGDSGNDVAVLEARLVNKLQASLAFSIGYVAGAAEPNGGMYTAAGARCVCA